MLFAVNLGQSVLTSYINSTTSSTWCFGQTVFRFLSESHLSSSILFFRLSAHFSSFLFSDQPGFYVSLRTRTAIKKGSATRTKIVTQTMISDLKFGLIRGDVHLFLSSETIVCTRVNSLRDNLTFCDATFHS